MIYNKKKHFYDPYDSLDAEWKARISHEMLSVREAARLSGFSRQYINKLIANGIIDAKKNNDGNYVIAWKKFVRWFSALPITLTSPIGYASYSLKELMRYTGMSRCWVLKFATRNSIPSYYVGLYRRFCKSACEEAWNRESIALKRWLTIEEAWNRESIALKRWLTIEEACTLLDVDEEVIYALAALHRTRVKRQNKSLVYNKTDILSVVKKGGKLCHE